MRAHALALVPALGLCLLLVPADARACSGPACDGRVVRTLDAGVAGNAPELALRVLWFGEVASGSVRLLRPDGGVVEAVSRVEGNELLLTPSVELAPGAYVVHAKASCSHAPDAGAVESTVQLEVLPSAPLPESLGQFSLAQVDAGPLSFPNGGSCSLEEPGAYARFALTPAPGLLPFLPSVRWTLRVDGVVWSRTFYGGVRADGTEVASAGASLLRNAQSDWPLLTAQALCSAQSSSHPGLAQGPHTAVLEAQLAGGPTWTSAPVAFTLTCPPAAPDAGPAPGDGGTGPDVSENGACAASPGAAVLALAALLAPALARRRRAR